MGFRARARVSYTFSRYLAQRVRVRVGVGVKG